jgi:3-oxoacyl-[acyl-carrier protein] reductase
MTEDQSTKFESIRIGDKAELVHTITQEDVERFVELTGDDNKLHVDEEYAEKTIFKKPVAHGMLGASFISTIIGTQLPGDGALWYSQSIEFLLPVRVGDKITVVAEVKNKLQKINSIELSTDIFNQNKQKVTTGVAKVKLIEQKKDEPDQERRSRSKKVALVIGGTGGIGQEVCYSLANDGYDVAIHYIRNRKLAEEIRDEILAQGSKAVIIQSDITDLLSVDEMIKKILRKLTTITTVVNCSTIRVPNIKFENLDWESFQKHFELNIKGTFNILKYVVPVMTAERYGKIISITTQYVETPKPELSYYITAKSGLSGLIKSLSLELAPKGIRLNLVSPGMTDTALISDVPEKVRLLTATQTPLRRLATTGDIAGVISFLASEKSDYLSGETIRVNGGQVML